MKLFVAVCLFALVAVSCSGEPNPKRRISQSQLSGMGDGGILEMGGHSGIGGPYGEQQPIPLNGQIRGQMGNIRGSSNRNIGNMRNTLCNDGPDPRCAPICESECLVDTKYYCIANKCWCQP